MFIAELVQSLQNYVLFVLFSWYFDTTISRWVRVRWFYYVVSVILKVRMCDFSLDWIAS